MRKKNAGSAKEPDSIYGSEEGHAGRVSGVFFGKETVKKITIFSPPVFLIKRGKVLGAFLQEGTMPIKIIKTLFVFPKSFFEKRLFKSQIVGIMVIAFLSAGFPWEAKKLFPLRMAVIECSL